LELPMLSESIHAHHSQDAHRGIANPCALLLGSH